MATIIRMDSLYMCSDIWFGVGPSDGGKNACTFLQNNKKTTILFWIKPFSILLQAIYPASVELSEKEKLNICYLAFPDSNSGCIGDTQFHIRLRVAPGTKNTLLNSELQRFSLQCVTVQRPDLGHYWGFVYFRQTKDTSLPRGYFQKVGFFAFSLFRFIPSIIIR